MTSATLRRILLVALAAGTTACAGRSIGPFGTVYDDTREPTRAESKQRELEEAMRRARAAVPARPDLVQPGSTEATKVWKAALNGSGIRILVGTESRSLWLMKDTTVLFRAPVAVGMEEGFTYKGRKYDFKTPVGRRRVIAKARDPIWVPPDWHYFELAVQRNLEVVHLKKGQRVKLGDGTFLEVRDDDVGRINQFGNYWSFTPGVEIIFDDTIYIPPIGSKQRRVPEILGTHKLELGDGYLIHGTNQDTSIGEAVSHGCVRMYNPDVEHLYSIVPQGTPVFIF